MAVREGFLEVVDALKGVDASVDTTNGLAICRGCRWPVGRVVLAQRRSLIGVNRRVRWCVGVPGMSLSSLFQSGRWLAMRPRGRHVVASAVGTSSLLPAAT